MEKVNFDDLVPKLDDEMLSSGTETIDQPIEEAGNENTEVDTVDNSDNITQPDPEIQIERTPEETNTDNANTDAEVTGVKGDKTATLFYQELVDNGIATPSEDKEEYSWDDVNSVINNYREELPRQIAEQLVTSAPKLGQDVIDFVFSKGDSLSKDDLNSFLTQYISDIESQNVEFKEVDQARSYLENKYKAQGIRETQIEVMLDALEDEGEEAMFEEANKYKQKDIENSKSKQMINESKEQQKAIEAQNKKFAQSLMTELSNTNWKPSRVQRVQQDLATGKTNEILSKAGSSPKALIQLANLATYFNEETGEFNFNDFINQAISPQAKSLKDKITKDMFSTGTTTKEKESNPNRPRFSDLVPKSPIN